MDKRFNLVAAAFSLTALSYGLARFAYGLLLPAISDDLALSAPAAGWIGGSAFAAYCLGIIFAFTFDRRFGSRAIAVAAGLAATVGLLLVAIAQSAMGIGLAMALAGLSTGLTSPPLAAAVAQVFADAERPRANGAINTGTAIGIVLSGLAVLALPGSWRVLYAIFASAGALVTLWLWFSVPRAESRTGNTPNSFPSFTRAGTGRLAGSAFLAGLTSTSIWTFGANLLREESGYSHGMIALAWIVLGAAGLIGIVTGHLTTRFGLPAIHRMSILLMALAIASLTLSSAVPPLGFAAMALFGTAYIVATGTFLLWGISLYPESPAFGLGLPFLLLALGQTAGAPLFGTALDLVGPTPTLLLFAATMTTAAFSSFRSASRS